VLDANQAQVAPRMPLPARATRTVLEALGTAISLPFTLLCCLQSELALCQHVADRVL